jgi:PhnB protein
MSFVPYIHFNGNAREAMQFYADVFGANDLEISNYSAAPAELGMPSSDAVLHSQMTVGGQMLMAADAMPGAEYRAQASVSISHAVQSFEVGTGIFDRLADGGGIVMPFAPTFFTPGFGMCKDKFGTHWMINVIAD